MIINDEIKTVIQNSAFLSLVTLCPDGTPHPIITGKGEVVGDTVVFGVFKMNETKVNLAANDNMWMSAATLEGGAKGYRLSGTGKINDKQLVFTPAKSESLL